MRPLALPGPLQPGDHARLVAPSGPVTATRLEAARAFAGSLGLRVSVGDHVLDRFSFGERGAKGLDYLAGTDAARAEDLSAAWCDPDVQVVWPLRGGYGVTRLLDHLDWTAMAAVEPKLVVGLSDLTGLLLALAARLGVGGLHGPGSASHLLVGDDVEPRTLASLRSCLFEPLGTQSISGGRSLIPAGPDGAADGVTLGGNLTLIASLVGTRYLPDARGAIVLLEDVNEEPYRIDRMLTQLLSSGWFEGVAGIACGTWESCGPKADEDGGTSPAVLAVLRDRLRLLGVPVVVDLPFGHGTVQSTIPIGVPARLDPSAGTLAVLPSDS